MGRAKRSGRGDPRGQSVDTLGRRDTTGESGQKVDKKKVVLGEVEPAEVELVEVMSLDFGRVQPHIF